MTKVVKERIVLYPNATVLITKMTKEDKLRVMYWGRSGKDSINKPEICKAIQKWFKENNLLEEKI